MLGRTKTCVATHSCQFTGKCARKFRNYKKAQLKRARACRVHTTLYGSAAGCRSIQKTCAFWKNGLTFENTQSQLTYFCKSNINQTFTNGSGMIWGVMIALFTEIRHLVEELITFLSFFGPQKLSILTARLNKSLLISTSNSMRGDIVYWSMPKPSQLLWEQQLLKNCDGTCERSCTPARLTE